MSKTINTTVTQQQWIAWLDLLATYRDERGHVNVDPFYVTLEGKWLGGWLLRCRREYGAGTLAADRITDLRVLGVDLDEKIDQPFADDADEYADKPPARRRPRPEARAGNWNDWLEDVAQFRAEHGHADIPNHYLTPDGRGLGNWLTQVRREYRAGTLPTEKANALAELGFNVARFGRQPARPRAKPAPWKPAGW